jgi:hypothetical protein
MLNETDAKSAASHHYSSGPDAMWTSFGGLLNPNLLIKKLLEYDRAPLKLQPSPMQGEAQTPQLYVRRR